MSNKKILNLKKNYFYLNLIIINVKLLKINIKFINYFYNSLKLKFIVNFYIIHNKFLKIINLYYNFFYYIIK